MSQAHHERAHELNGKLDELVNMGTQRQAGLSNGLKEWKQELFDAFAGTEEKRRHYLDVDAVYEAILKILRELKSWVGSGDRVSMIFFPEYTVQCIDSWLSPVERSQSKENC